MESSPNNSSTASTPRGASSSKNRHKGLIHLNVGGVKYSTTVETLTSVPNTLFTTMFNSKFDIEKDEKGRVFIDRNGELFKHILEYLRCGEIPELQIPSKQFCRVTDCLKLYQLVKESSFYGLEKLERELLDKLVQWETGSTILKTDRDRNLYIYTSTFPLRPPIKVRLLIANIATSSSQYHFVGIATTKVNKTNFKQNKGNFYAYNLNTGNKIIGDKTTSYGMPLSANDIITLEINAKGEVSFMKNELELGVAFQMNLEEPIYLAAVLYSERSSLEIMDPQYFAHQELIEESKAEEDY